METESKGYNLNIKLNNFSVSYDDLGVDNNPVIFLHGYPFDKTMWQNQLDFLKSSNRVIACDIRGFGKSTDEYSSLSMDLFADDLIEFMDMLHIEKAIICGLSMGGFIALNAQKRFPERFEALILCDTQCISDTKDVQKKRYEIMNQITAEGVTDFNEGFVKSVFHKDSLIHKKERVEKLREIVFSNSEHIIIMGLKALAERSETCSTLNEIQIPTMIICGREDEVTPLKESEFMHKNIEGSELHIIENAGHVPNLEHPEEFNTLLMDFVTHFNLVKIHPLNHNHTDTR